MGVGYLLDTYILLWWLFNDPKFDTQCRDIIRNPKHCLVINRIIFLVFFLNSLIISQSAKIRLEIGYLLVLFRCFDRDLLP